MLGKEGRPPITEMPCSRIIARHAHTWSFVALAVDVSHLHLWSLDVGDLRLRCKLRRWEGGREKRLLSSAYSPPRLHADLITKGILQSPK